MWAAGAVTPSRKRSFVLRATPRPGGTSREVSYSVRHYHTRFAPICKYPNFPPPEKPAKFQFMELFQDLPPGGKVARRAG